MIYILIPKTLTFHILSLVLLVILHRQMVLVWSRIKVETYLIVPLVSLSTRVPQVQKTTNIPG